MDADLGDRCGLGDAGVRYAFRRLEEFTVVLDPLNFPLVVEMMQHVRLGTIAPKAPVWLYHSVLDEGIPFAQPAHLEADWCARGADVIFHADLFSEHVIPGATGAPTAIKFLIDRFAGRPTRDNCA